MLWVFSFLFWYATPDRNGNVQNCTASCWRHNSAERRGAWNLFDTSQQAFCFRPLFLTQLLLLYVFFLISRTCVCIELIVN